MFVETQRAFKAGVKQNTMADAGQTIIDMVSADLAQASDAQNPFITNLYWGWVGANTSSNYQDSTGEHLSHQPVAEHLRARPYQQPVAGRWLRRQQLCRHRVGTLYSIWTGPMTPQSRTICFSQISSLMSRVRPFATNYFHRVADGVVHLKLRAFDQAGNESAQELGFDFAAGDTNFAYPRPPTSTRSDSWCSRPGCPASSNWRSASWSRRLMNNCGPCPPTARPSGISWAQPEAKSKSIARTSPLPEPSDEHAHYMQSQSQTSAHSADATCKAAPAAQSALSDGLSRLSEAKADDGAQPRVPEFKTENSSAIALVITLLMLSVITFLAVAFLVLTRSHRDAVTASLDNDTAKGMSEAATARAQSQIIARMAASGDILNYDFFASHNWINPLASPTARQTGTTSITTVTSAAGVRDESRPSTTLRTGRKTSPMLFTTRARLCSSRPTPTPTSPADFRFWVDLNRNGKFETNGFLPVITNNGHSIAALPTVISTANRSGLACCNTRTLPTPPPTYTSGATPTSSCPSARRSISITFTITPRALPADFLRLLRPCRCRESERLTDLSATRASVPGN